MLPVSTTPRTLSGRTPRPRSSPAKSRSSWPASASRRGRTPISAHFPMRVITSAPKGACAFSSPAAAGLSGRSGSQRYAATVVVPMSAARTCPRPKGDSPAAAGSVPPFRTRGRGGESAWTVQLPSARAQQASRTLESCSSVVSSRFSSAERGESSP